MKERLQKVMSNCGVASRRASEQMILDGRVRVNGVIVRELGTKADPETDIILVDGKRLEAERNCIICSTSPKESLRLPTMTRAAKPSWIISRRLPNGFIP